MATLIAGALAVFVLYTLLQMFRAANPAVLARGVKIAGGIVALAVAAFTGLRGEIAVALPLGFFGAGLLGWAPFGNSGFNPFGGLFGGAGQGPMRAPMLELTPEPGGGLSGRILAGPHAGQPLAAFDLSQLIAMRGAFDGASAGLLEAYLDRRFPGWRQHAEGDAAGGQRRAASRGKMSDEEAYEILGVKPGAGRDEISRAHRSLMKKLHPDQGGSTYLAARVNEAKDTLLRSHQR